MRISDWSSDVCSSDLELDLDLLRQAARRVDSVGVQDLDDGWGRAGHGTLVHVEDRAGRVVRPRHFRHPLALGEDFDHAPGDPLDIRLGDPARSEEHTSDLQSLMRISYAVFCLQKKN